MANVMRLGGGVGSKTTIGASYNADGTQNLIIKDDGSVIEIPDPNPVLLWTNASPTSEFAAQDITVGQYAGCIVECRGATANANTRKVFVANGENFSVVIPTNNTNAPGRCTARNIGYSGNTVTINGGVYQSTSSNSVSTGNAYCIPTRIWGVKFTL